MAAFPSLRHAVAHLRRLAGESCPDDCLLDRFARDRDQAAFAELVHRHGPMVLGVSRRLLGDSHAAEDVFQATFLVLARKAGAIGWKPCIAPWLYGTASRLAYKARAARRRHCAESSAYTGLAAPSSDPATPLLWDEVRQALDEEMLRLPEQLRGPLVLCYLEGRTRDEAARSLGCSLAMLKRRLASGRNLLRQRLERRGLSLAAAGVGLALPLTPVSAAVGAATAEAAATFIASGKATPAVAALLARTWGIAMVRWSLLALTLLTCGVGALAFREKAAEPPAPADAPAPPAVAAKPAAARTIRVVVLDPQGKPLADAKIHASIWTNEKGFKANRDYYTDAAGTVQVELPKTFYILRLWARKTQYAPMFANWEQNELASGSGPGDQYTFRLERAVAARGRIVDEHGKPIAGAQVRVMVANKPKPAQSDGRASYNTWLAEANELVTDSQGRWQIANVPDHRQLELSLLVSHPDYVSDDRWGVLQKAAGITTAMLLQGTATLTLKPGVIVRGTVTDPAGKPLKDALVVVGDDPYFSQLPSKFPTDSEGRFRLPTLPPGETTLTVIAHGWAPQMHKVSLRPALQPQNFRMGPGKTLRLRIVDSAGKPMRAIVHLLGWNGKKSLSWSHNSNHPAVPDPKIPSQADANGIWEWTWAPDGPVRVYVYLPGFAYPEAEIAAGEPMRTIVLKSEHRITGRVTDVVTGKPIPEFTIIPIDVFRKDWLHAERGNAKAGKDGRLEYLAERTDIPLRLRIEALGYRTETGSEYRVGDDTSLLQNFKLQPSKPVSGVVLDSIGRPVAKAEVVLATPTQEGRILDRGRGDNHKSFTDAEGRFAFPDPGELWAVFAQSESGVAFAEFPAGRHDAGTLRLKPWASVQGQLHDGGKPVSGATVFLEPIRTRRLDRPLVDATLKTATGPDGRFQFERVPPIPSWLAVYLGPWKEEGFRSAPRVPFDLKPGEQVKLDLGSAGATVKGNVKLTGKVPTDLDCTYSLNYLIRRAPGIAAPPEIAKLGFDIQNGWRESWQKSQEGVTYRNTLHHWFVKLAADGSFRISGVPPGEYDLAIEVYAKPSGCLIDSLARKQVRVTVTAADVARGELALPGIEAAVTPLPSVGDTPALAFQRADGTNGTLVDFRGRCTLVHFWTSWCAPCKQQLPALRQLHERYAVRGLASVGLSLDEDGAAWQIALKQLDLPWPQARLAADSDLRVSSVPAYWLLDPAGKIVAKGYDPDELAAALADRLK